MTQPAEPSTAGHAASEPPRQPGPASTNERGRRRREELLQLAVEDLLSDGLREFSMRRVAKRAGTSHRMLLYHFGSQAQLLREAITEIRRRYLARARAAAEDPLGLARELLADRSPEARVLAQGMLRAALEPEQYADLGRDYRDAYLPIIESCLPDAVTGELRSDLAELVLCTVRGALLDATTTGDPAPSQRALALLLQVGASMRG